ncbi:CinA family protein [bacterium]|nr:CinA family protein [bacterium]
MIYGSKESELARRIGESLLYQGLTISTAESLTGGGLSACLVSVPGSSSWFKGSAVAYQNEIKRDLLKVPQEVLDREGAVSEECVRRMAEGSLRLFDTDIAVAVSGVAGPGGDGSANPVGTVWIGLAIRSRTVAKKFLFKGDREHIRRSTILAALDMIDEII